VTPHLPTPSRREVLRAAAAGAAGLGTAACGGGGGGTASGTPTPSTRAATVDALNAALVREHTAVDAYGVALPLLGTVTTPLGRAFRQHHADHRDRLGQIVRALGGTPTPAQDRYDIGPSPGDEHGAVNLLAALEDRSTAAHYTTLQRLTDPSLLQTLGSIMADEAQHAAVLRSALQLDPAPASFVTAG